jgi:hypothetical protein
MQGDLKPNTGMYYGRSDLSAEEKSAATVAIAEELRKRAPDSADFARDLVVSYYKLASFCGQQNRNQDANKYWALCKKAILYMKERGMFVDPPVEQVLLQIEGMGI